ncbi:hypothetical protein [Lactobacillus delbrueckii]|uniref:hypothetical protein n=1 Tax=Lactobacillus delbrueckii TaxID=1584 RepID=UPI00107116DE|nr:hypothetical protein [Lactobacillus delbrueckii]
MKMKLSRILTLIVALGLLGSAVETISSSVQPAKVAAAQKKTAKKKKTKKSTSKSKKKSVKSVSSKSKKKTTKKATSKPTTNSKSNQPSTKPSTTNLIRSHRLINQLTSQNLLKQWLIYIIL